MTDEQEEPKAGKAAVKRPVYRARMHVVLTSDWQCYEPGTILDLSHLPKQKVEELVKRGVYELADGEPQNRVPPSEVKRAGGSPCKGC